jgi:hypothetical protein
MSIFYQLCKYRQLLENQIRLNGINTFERLEYLMKEMSTKCPFMEENYKIE